MVDVGLLLKASFPYLVMILCQLLAALFLVLQQSVLADGVSAIVLNVFCIQCKNTATLPPRTLVGISRRSFTVRIPAGEQLLLTASLRYITSTFESVELNTVPVLVFVVSVLVGREKFGFWSLNGQAKLLGLLSSAVGAIVLVIFEDSKGSNVKNAQGPNDRLTGYFLLGLAALIASAAYLFLEKLTLKFRMVLTLTAIMTVFGTIQLVVLAAIIERNYSSWKIKWSNSLHVSVILYGGIVIAAMVNFARIWCIHKKGPVFVLAFTPLLIVYSFLFQTLVFQVSPQFWSIVAASFVIGGLYILLWAKSRDSEARKVDSGDEQNQLFESSTAAPLLENI